MHTEPPGCAKQRNKCTSKVPSVCLSKLYNIITVPLGSKYTHLFSEEKKKEKKNHDRKQIRYFYRIPLKLGFSSHACLKRPDYSCECFAYDRRLPRLSDLHVLNFIFS